MRWTWLMVMAACSGSSAPVDTVPFETCQYSLAAWCAGAPGSTGCPMTWTAAQDKQQWQCPLHLMLYNCGRDHVAVQPFIETHSEFQYDADGALYRVDYETIHGVQPTPCAGGAGPFLAVTDRCDLVADLSGCP